MPRPPRIDLPGIPHHVVQRGNDRQPCFFIEADYLCYRTLLREAALREGCVLHAYVLMTNHVHLLLTPQQSRAVSRTLQSLGRRYVRYINDTHHRSGTLWEGRYKASLVGDGDYLMHCHRYIELNPLRAAMVADPREYRWSSHHALAFGEADPLVHRIPPTWHCPTLPQRANACIAIWSWRPSTRTISTPSVSICNASTPTGASASGRPLRSNLAEAWGRRKSGAQGKPRRISAHP